MIDAEKSAVVAQHFGLWTPPRPCPFSPKSNTADTHGIFCELHQEHFYHDHEIPAPDLTQPEWFVRLLKMVNYPVTFEKGTILVGNKTVTSYAASCAGDTWGEGDTPEAALLAAVYEIVAREKK